MFGLLAFHEIAARRGDGLLPQFFKLLLEQPPSEGLTSIHGGLAEKQPTVACFRYDPRTDGLSAAKAAGIKHHIALSVVGDERLPKSAYLRAKLVQERLIRDSGIPYTIVYSSGRPICSIDWSST